jgi:Fe(3+) dicitrate transport protein
LWLSIGGRGLDPNRTSNFNTRQNGYDISADVLGILKVIMPLYRSFRRNTSNSWSRLFAIRYTIWRFSELQDKIADKKPFEFTSRNTIGSYGLFTNFTVSGTNKKFSYYRQFTNKEMVLDPTPILKAKIILPI